MKVWNICLSKDLEAIMRTKLIGVSPMLLIILKLFTTL
jgi:hypothetical protein